LIKVKRSEDEFCLKGELKDEEVQRDEDARRKM
jgi:hypothetical protein